MSAYCHDRLCFVRILGWGLHVKDTRRHPLLYSERNGYHTRLQLGAWSIRLLTPRTGRK